MAVCDHLDQITVLSVPADVPGCEDCLAIGGRWVHLRMCHACGHIGVLRLVAEPPRAGARRESSGHPVDAVGRAGGGVVLLLRGRRRLRRPSGGAVVALPELRWAPGEPVKETLHLYAQIVGKVKLAVAPPRNHWWHVDTAAVTPTGSPRGRCGAAT